ncbi:MAG: NAD-dependent epimerase/dehydratase family protein [Deltaproteobacteria bacterium]|nr:NAD-dependent epimerase/dehydratase family protein [Deltaproteobacteria bacterium]
MGKRILITGGAGFIGSHLADELVRRGYRVRALDNLTVQVHGDEARRPGYLNPEVELIVGDVRDGQAVRRSLSGVDAVFHFAAMVGVGQSMYEVEKYTSVNSLGTGVLLEALIDRPVERLVVSSSMSIYGEGLYRDPEGRICLGQERTLHQLRAGDWEVRGESGEVLTPIPTPETKVPSLASVYALSKYDQERMCLIVGRAYGLSTTALRFFNVFGIRQALSNPYTGVLAIFAARFLNGNCPLIYEDGHQQRDFVSVYDVVRACCLALEHPQAPGQVFNVGSGQPQTVRNIAQCMAAVLGKEGLHPHIIGKYRAGDIRHCFADISLIRRTLGYEPQVKLEEGLVELASWLEGQKAFDRLPEAAADLSLKGLTV